MRVPTWGRVPPDNRIIKSHMPTESVCYEDFLYSLELTAPDQRQMVEIEHLKRIDDEAAKTISKINKGENLSLEERVIFARYLYKLHLRHPKIIERMERYFLSDPSLHVTEENLLQIGAVATPEAIAEINRKLMNDASRRVLLQSEQSDNVTNALLELNWYLFDVSNCYDWIPLITSDSPLVILNGLRSPMTEVYFPLSPKLLFWGSRSELIKSKKVRLREISKTANRQQANAAQRFVFGDSNIPFVDRYLKRI